MSKKKHISQMGLLLAVMLIFVFISSSNMTSNVPGHDFGGKESDPDVISREDDIPGTEMDDLNHPLRTSASDPPDYSGIADPWNVTHWANRTDKGISVSFSNNSYDSSSSIPLASGWNGYKLNATISDLYDTRNWVNGTFHEGSDDGDSSSSDDDSADVLNWTFNKYKENVATDNLMSGNYYDGSTGDPIEGEDYIELQISKGSGNVYDANNTCWWSTIFEIPRGAIASGQISLSINPYVIDGFGNSFQLEFYVNSEFVHGKGLYSLR